MGDVLTSGVISFSDIIVVAVQDNVGDDVHNSYLQLCAHARMQDDTNARMQDDECKMVNAR